MKTERRSFLKSQALAATAAVAGIPIVVEPAQAQAGPKSAADVGVRWDKAPCRFCGTGCAVMVGVQDGRVVATQGDPDSQVNRGLNCIKGYFLSKIMYGEDRLTRPLLRMKPATALAMQWRALGSMLLLRKPAFHSLVAA